MCLLYLLRTNFTVLAIFLTFLFKPYKLSVLGSKRNEICLHAMT